MKTAVLLYGFLRTFEITAASLLKNIVKPNNADIFVFAYDNTGVSRIESGVNINKQKAINAAKQDLEGDIIDICTLKKIYGDALKKVSLQSYSDYTKKFKNDSSGVYSPIFPIDRFFSLYFNISGAIKLLIEYEKETRIIYDNIIIARPDLQFYSQINLSNFDMNKLNIASYGGNINPKGENEAYYCCYYKNIEKMEYIPFHKIIFSDQLIISKAQNLKCLDCLYENLKEYEKQGLPVCHPETVLYYHIGYKQNLDIQTNDIRYEILRNNFISKENEFTVENTNRKINKKIKYKNKIINDLQNIKNGMKSLFSISLNFIKYLIVKGKNQ